MSNPLLRAFGLFSVVPVPAGDALTRADAVAALRLLPLVGVALGAAAGLPMVAVHAWAHRPDAAIGAVLAVAVLALLTRGLHLDGLADTADGLGSRAPAERALEIMRRSDIGPFGVITIVLVLLLDALALAGTGDGMWTPLAALTVAAATGRVAVLIAAARPVPSARAEGFGAYVAGSVGPWVLGGWLVVLLAGSAGLADAVGARPVAWVVAPLVALALTTVFLAHVVRRIGGVTGDVFGAVVEIGTVLTLAGLALAG
jgi:adenosylcobinamide-GDP ribazoletransferase